MKLLKPESVPVVATFLNSPAWADLKECLLANRPEAADAGEAVHTQAARGFQRQAFESAVDMMQTLPFERSETEKSPFERPALDPKD